VADTDLGEAYKDRDQFDGLLLLESILN